MTAPTGVDPRTDLEPGSELLPGYRALSLLSRGHRLDVVDAWSDARQCRCVVKLARPDRRTEPDVRQRLLDEAALLTSLDHPHWVRLYEVIDGPDTALVLETLPGVTLAALLDDVRRVRAADAMILGAQLASALSYLHRQGWLHLDLTPTNVVVTGGVATLIDLSLARRPGPARSGAGTAGYRSPEQIAGGELTAATDVWGLALLLHEALSGAQPGTPHQPDGAAPLRRRRGVRRSRHMPADLVDLLNACLSPSPQERPTLATVLRGLGGFPDPLTAPPPVRVPADRTKP